MPVSMPLSARRLMFSILILLVAAPSFAGNIIHVPGDQPTIQAGINVASNGDTVLVSAGTYKENISFNGKAITVTSQSGPAVTIIDGQQLGTVVSFTGGETRESILRGFTVQNGSQGGLTGVGINIVSGSPTIAGNVIVSNTSCGGGAVASGQGSPLIEDNIIHNNSISCGGAAVSVTDDTADDITGNVVSGNSGNGIEINTPAGDVTLLGNTVINNAGVGVMFEAYAYSNTAEIVQNVIANNLQVGLYWNDPAITVVNNTVLENMQGGCCYQSSDVEGTLGDGTTIENNLVVGTNSISVFSCDQYSADAVFDNNDVFGTSGPPYGGQCPDFTGGMGNLSADPLFVDALGNNYHIQSASVAVNAGDNAAPDLPSRDFDGDKRILGKAIDIGADEYSPKTTLTLSAYNLHYESQQVGQVSDPQLVTLTNHGAETVRLLLIATGTDFSQANNCHSSLAAGGSCQINVRFDPIGGGWRNGVLGIFTNASPNPQTVSLGGTGVAPSVYLSTTYISFYQQVIGTQGQQSDTLTNVGQAPLTISSFALSGSADFTQTNNCPVAPSTLGAGASCTITVYYLPTIIGYETATLNIYDNALPSPQQVNLSGNSVSAGYPSLNPSSLTFPPTLIGSSSAPQYSTLTNTGTGNLGSISVGSYSDFTATSDCPVSLAPGASCTITVVYSPTQLGNEYGTVYVSNDSPYQGQISTSGTGEAPVPTLTSLSLSNAAAGSPDTFMTITGSGFVYGSQVSWNGNYIPASPNGSTQLIFTVPASYLATPGTAQVAVFNPSPGGGTSNSATFTIYTPISYAAKSIPYRYETITGTNLNFFYLYGGWITSPFPIQFGGGSYTNLDVDAGGNLSVVASGGEYNSPLPDPYASNIIAPFWANLYPWGTGNDNNVFWQVLGTAPNRELVVEWRDVSYCCDSSGQYTVKFQVVFAENKPEILFNYADTVFGGPFSADDNGATATVGIQLTPSVATQYSYDTPSLASQTSLLWYPNSPTVNLSTSDLDFGYHLIGTRSPTQKVTVTNGGVAPLQISNIAVDNQDFQQENNCGHLLKSGQSCQISVAFTPSQPTLEAGTLTIADNGPGGFQQVNLSGIGSTTSVVIFPTYLNFGNVPVGQTRTLPVTLADAADQTMTIQQITANPGVFTETNNCGSSLDPGAYCTIEVTFAPVQKGGTKGTLNFGINGKPTQPKVALAGMGS